jgi:hypothetical protein
MRARKGNNIAVDAIEGLQKATGTELRAARRRHRRS